MKVTILQYRLFHYRIGFFEALRRLASEAGVDLHVVHGQPSPAERAKQDTGELPWAEFGGNWYLPIKEKKDLCWQRMPAHLKDSDLVIFMQENRLLSNYYWIVRRKFGGPKVAYWGHGRDFQSNSPGGLREKWKNRLITAVDWWFAYTSMSVDVVREAGFPADRITCVNNSIDTAGMLRDADQVTDEQLNCIRQELNLSEGAPLGLFCGSLYADKKLDLLVAAGDRIAAACPEFRLVVIGDGGVRPQLEADFASRPWAKWVGVKRGVEKAAYFNLARFVLNPGLVGLHVLDAFVMGLPMITTAQAKHSPEIAYLKDGVNGVVTDDVPAPYSEAAIRLIEDPSACDCMSAAARKTAAEHSVEDMAQRFFAGILAAGKS